MDTHPLLLLKFMFRGFCGATLDNERFVCTLMMFLDKNCTSPKGDSSAKACL